MMNIDEKKKLALEVIARLKQSAAVHHPCLRELPRRLLLRDSVHERLHAPD